MPTKASYTATCSCGAVELAFTGPPIATLSCCCEDCQSEGARLEALPGAPRFREPCGGTPVAQFHRDAMRIVKGGERLEAFRKDDKTATKRMVATCCNTAMHFDFDRGPFWVGPLLARMGPDAPPPSMRIMTKRLKGPAPEDGIPNSKTFPPRLIWQILRGWYRGGSRV